MRFIIHSKRSAFTLKDPVANGPYTTGFMSRRPYRTICERHLLAVSIHLGYFFLCVFPRGAFRKRVLNVKYHERQVLRTMNYCYYPIHTVSKGLLSLRRGDKYGKYRIFVIFFFYANWVMRIFHFNAAICSDARLFSIIRKLPLLSRGF